MKLSGIILELNQNAQKDYLNNLKTKDDGYFNKAGKWIVKQATDPENQKLAGAATLGAGAIGAGYAAKKYLSKKK